MSSRYSDGTSESVGAQKQIDLILNVDTLVGRAATSLIELAAECRPQEDAHRRICCDALYFPPWVGGGTGPPAKGKHLLTRALCCATLQRLLENKRRFSWLAPKDLKRLDDLGLRLASTFIPKKPDLSLDDYAECISSETFEGVNPLTASQVLRVLLYGGENRAHTGIGFLAFFVIVWFLLRRFPEGNIRGVILEPSRSTAYVTAKCLFPIKLLADICQRRARLYEDLQSLITRIDRVAAEQGSVASRWRFASALSELSINLSDMAKVAVARDAFLRCSDSVEDHADGLNSYSDSATVWEKVKSELVTALKATAVESESIWREVSAVVTQIELMIVNRLKSRSPIELAKRTINIGGPLENVEMFWTDHVAAAEEALSICKEAAAYLEKTTQLKSIANIADASTLVQALTVISTSNQNLADRFQRTGADSARWCRSVVEREIAHASAGNTTDFDAAELVSAIATAVRWRNMTSPLEIADASHKAIQGGSRSDGSWAPGQPFYTQGRLLGAYPISSDIMWLLVSAIKQYPEVTVADDAIERHVCWLGRRMSEIALKEVSPRFKMIGWASEHSGERNRIDLWATAFSINALLEIRDLAEDRIWHLCKQRFNVVSPTKSLALVDPVDLGAAHRYRLHRRLSKMARDAQMAEPDAEYAFMLHGPPGSSKTAMAQAVAKEMWRGSSASSQRLPRLLRITPADFTRYGEDRLDAEARLIFNLITHIRGAVILFDEVDDLLRKRDPATRPVFMELIIPAMLNRLADLSEACPRQELCYIFATNFVQTIEAALMRRGRLDATVPVVYPDTESRIALVERRIQKLRDESKDRNKKEKAAMHLDKAKDEIVAVTGFWPWMTIQDFLDELCEHKAAFDLETGQSTQEFDELVKRYESELNKPPYPIEALFKPPIPRQLLDEFLHYSFSGWSTLDEYKDGFKQELKEWIQQSKASYTAEDDMRVTTILGQGAELWVREGRRQAKPTPVQKKRRGSEISRQAA